MHQLRTLVGPQRFISGSVCPSNPFERELSFASPSKRAAESQNFWRLSNRDASVCVHRWAVSPALRSRSSEREKKLSNQPAAYSFFQTFRPVDLKSPTDLSDIPTDLTDLWADLWSLASHAQRGTMSHTQMKHSCADQNNGHARAKTSSDNGQVRAKTKLIGKEIIALLWTSWDSQIETKSGGVLFPRLHWTFVLEVVRV